MSVNHHTPFAANYALTKSNWNSPLSQLDTVITNAQAGTQAYSGVQLEGGTIGASALTGTNATDKGHRLPAMTTTQRDAIASPATGLMVFNVTTGLINIYNGTSWSNISVLQYVLLAEGESTDVVDVDIDAINQTYKDLILIGHARSRSGTSPDNLRLRFNDDTTASAHEGGGKYWTSTLPNLETVVSGTSIDMRLIPDANTDAEWYSNFMLTIPFYARVATELGGWFYATHRSEPDNIFYRQIGVWRYIHASSTAVAKITLFSGDAANIDLKWKLYARGIS